MNERLKALAIATLLSVVSLLMIYFGYFIPRYEMAIPSDSNSMRGLLNANLFSSHKAIVKNLGSHTLTVFGSSELSSQASERWHPRQYMNYDDMNFMLLGAGYYQSLIHANTLGSIGADMPNKKVALILSCQWFAPQGLTPPIFASRTSLEHSYYMIQNLNLSKETKLKLLNRMLDLSTSSKSTHSTLLSYKRELEGQAWPWETWFNKLRLFNMDIGRTWALVKSADIYPGKSVKTLGYYQPKDWDADLVATAKEGEKHVINNKYGIEDGYYEMYIRSKEEQLKDSEKNVRYDESPEFTDLQLFLQVARELNIEVSLFMIPTQGAWSDYTGLSKDMLKAYEKKIYTVTEAYQPRIYNFMDKSHEEYFFKDIMHFGWKGWIYVQRALVDFAGQGQ